MTGFCILCGRQDRADQFETVLGVITSMDMGGSGWAVSAMSWQGVAPKDESEVKPAEPVETHIKTTFSRCRDHEACAYRKAVST